MKELDDAILELQEAKSNWNGKTEAGEQAIWSAEEELNRVTETLQNRVMEECSEVIHAICKLIRFGTTQSKTNPITNIERVLWEIEDLEKVIGPYKRAIKEATDE